MIPNPSKFFKTDDDRDKWEPIEFEDYDLKFGVSFELLEPFLEGKKTLRQTPGFICICGHPINSHISAYHYKCSGSISIQCRCDRIDPCLDVEDVRYFFHETRGYMHNHALQQGIDHLAADGFNFLKLSPWRCFTDSSHVGPFFATALDKFEYISLVSMNRDMFLCLNCILKALKKYPPEKSSRPKSSAEY